MSITKAQKKDIIESLEKVFGDAKSVVFVKFKALTVANANQMRRKLKSEGVGYKVARKTLIRKALEHSKISGTLPDLSGEIAFAYGADLVSPARSVFEFQKQFKDAVSIEGGVFDGVFMGKDEMRSIALIPPMKTLYAQLLNLINSPIQGFVVALDQIAKKKSA
jgi:large subunit ribosomal protein L10